ncbi:hypothetical protein A4A49_51737 [Nicotiana attenuata]|uniref:Uncharacterized protein n=1 Tax=Nicotiana attenuata TaxID=49451 RepID=A0A1J6IZJ8_NICAT|nr:hypothetical protein A4A49_51737 [Nicotiana attenuata]
MYEGVESPIYLDLSMVTQSCSYSNYLLAEDVSETKSRTSSAFGLLLCIVYLQ